MSFYKGYSGFLWWQFMRNTKYMYYDSLITCTCVILFQNSLQILIDGQGSQILRHFSKIKRNVHVITVTLY